MNETALVSLWQKKPPSQPVEKRRLHASSERNAVGNGGMRRPPYGVFNGALLVHQPSIAVHPRFGGDSNAGDEVRRFHPEGMPAISRGLSVRDTPGTTAQKGELHPEGMLASSECLPSSRG